MQKRTLRIGFQCTTLKEFVIRDKQGRVEELIATALNAGFLAGVPLAQWYPKLKDCFLIAVTEKRTKQEIDAFAKSLAQN